MRNATTNDDDSMFNDFELGIAPNSEVEPTDTDFQDHKSDDKDIDLEEIESDIAPLSTEAVYELVESLQGDDDDESAEAGKQIILALKENRVLLFSNEAAEIYVKAYRNNRDVYIPALHAMSDTFSGIRLLDDEMQTIINFYQKHQNKFKNMNGIGDIVTFLPTIAFDKLSKKTFSSLKTVTQKAFDREVFMSHRWSDFIEVFEEEGIEIEHFMKLVNLLSVIQNTQKPTQNGSK